MDEHVDEHVGEHVGEQWLQHQPPEQDERNGSGPVGIAVAILAAMLQEQGQNTVSGHYH
jgi:hypothetical protein